METGRKFWITLLVEVLMFATVVLAAIRFPAEVAVTVATIAIPAMGGLGMTFIAGNAAISWQAIKNQTDTSTTTENTNTQVTKQIVERRDPTTGVEPTT